MQNQFTDARLPPGFGYDVVPPKEFAVQDNRPHHFRPFSSTHRLVIVDNGHDEADAIWISNDVPDAPVTALQELVRAGRLSVKRACELLEEA